MENTVHRGLSGMLGFMLLALALLALFAASGQVGTPVVQHQSDGDRKAITATTGPDSGLMQERRVGVAGRNVIPAEVTATRQTFGWTSTTWTLFGVLGALLVVLVAATAFNDRRLARMSPATAGGEVVRMPERRAEDESRRKAA